MKSIMKLAAIVILRDELDILELFFRINSRVIDHFFVIDTAFEKNFFIIDKLKERENIDITVFRDLSGNLNEENIVWRALVSALRIKNFDWAFILDFDEFINIDKSELVKELSIYPPNVTPFIKHSTWVPNNNDYFKYKNPLWSNFRRRSSEYLNMGKAIIHTNVVTSVTLSPIFHAVYSNGILLPQYILKCGTLDHVPVRHSSQIISKAITGSYKLYLKSNRMPNEKFYWDSVAKNIRQYNFDVDDILLRYLALTYTSPKEILDIDGGVDEDSRLGIETDIMRYGKHEYNPFTHFDVFMKKCSSTVRARIK